MKSIRVLVVDDSAVIRRLLTNVLSSDEEIEVVGTAPNASLAMDRLNELQPDILTLDVEMPGVSGLDLLIDIRKKYPKLPVIMFSSLTQRAAAITLEGLARGATDYVTKPANTGSMQASIDQVKEQLIPKIKALSGRNLPSKLVPRSRPITTKNTLLPNGQEPLVLLIGSSTGGPNALAELFSKLTTPLPVPILITQHMPPLFTQMLAQRLNTLSKIKVKEAADGDVLEAGVAYIAPGDFHLLAVRKNGKVSICLDQELPENSCRPSVDVMLRSAASVWGGQTLTVILTGMGQDGLKGCELLRAQGGVVIAQDEASSVVWGMPGFVAKAGLAHQILPISDISNAIMQHFKLAKSVSLITPLSSAPELRHASQ